MRWASAISEHTDFDAALAEAQDAIDQALAGAEPDLVLAFVTAHHSLGAEARVRLPLAVADRWRRALVLGATGGGVIGGGREIEQRPALSLLGAVLPGAQLRPFRLDARNLPEPATAASALRRLVGVEPEARPGFIVLGDPFSLDAERLLAALDGAYPGAVKIGGMAAGGRFPGQNALFLDGRVHRDGVVGVALAGRVALDAIVAQGCRPVGRPLFVTRCEGNVAVELNRKPAIAVLEDLLRSLDARDRELARRSLFFGVVMDESAQEHHLGDFLVRNVVGQDPATGGLVVGAPLRDLQVVQFHLRDATTSAEELEALLERHRHRHGATPPEGALLCSCVGRGVGLYGEPDHDTRAFQRRFGDVPVGGFFGNGEIGPVRGTSFVHGYTSAFGLFRTREAAS